MQARLIAYPPDDAAVVRLVPANARLRIGRVGDCDLVLDHASVSRAHAELCGAGDQWRLVDLDSKNGSHVDGVRIKDAPLLQACWLRFGDVYCEVIPLAETQATADALKHRAHRQAATAH